MTAEEQELRHQQLALKNCKITTFAQIMLKREIPAWQRWLLEQKVEAAMRYHLRRLGRFQAGMEEEP